MKKECPRFFTACDPRRPCYSLMVSVYLLSSHSHSCILYSSFMAHGSNFCSWHFKVELMKITRKCQESHEYFRQSTHSSLHVNTDKLPVMPKYEIAEAKELVGPCGFFSPKTHPKLESLAAIFGASSISLICTCAHTFASRRVFHPHRSHKENLP